VAKCKEFNEIFEFWTNVEHFLGECLTDSSQKSIFFSRKLKEKLETAYFGLLVCLMLMFILDF
jgi:hypothetical protein